MVSWTDEPVVHRLLGGRPRGQVLRGDENSHRLLPLDRSTVGTPNVCPDGRGTDEGQHDGHYYGENSTVHGLRTSGRPSRGHFV